MQRDLDTIRDMLNGCIAIIKFTSEISEDDFYSDEKTQSAVIYQLMIIGEASRRLSNDFLKNNPSVPWQDWRGFRNILIHQYDGIELEQVWYTISREIPDLKKFLEMVIAK